MFKLELTDKQVYNAEETVTHFSDATGLSEKEVVLILEGGLNLHYEGKVPVQIKELIEELYATFDAY